MVLLVVGLQYMRIAYTYSQIDSSTYETRVSGFLSMVGHLFIMLLKGWGRERRGGRRKGGEISSSATDTKTCRKLNGHPTSRNANVACCCTLLLQTRFITKHQAMAVFIYQNRTFETPSAVTWTHAQWPQSYTEIKRHSHVKCSIYWELRSSGHYAVSSRNSLPTFRNKLSVPSSRVKNLNKKPAQAKPYGVYIKKGGGGDKFSVAWCQPIGLIQVVGREEVCGNQSSSEDRRSVREEILTGVIARHRRTYTWAKCEKREERKCNIWIINR